MMIVRALWISCAAFALFGYLSSASAENAIGIGNVSERTAAASALVNDGLSAFHLMLAAIDRSDSKSAAEQREKAFKSLASAEGAYADIAPAADDHVLSPTPTSDAERTDVEYFMQHRDAYKLGAPYHERELISAAGIAVGSFARRIKELQMPRLTTNIRAQQSIAADAIEMQRFLLSITTMIHLG